MPGAATAMVDLNADGRAELIVLARDRDHCGSGGCTMVVAARTATGYRTVSRTTVVRAPVRVLATRHGGWHDLSVTVAGGGIRTPRTVRLRFDGHRYPANPTVPPARPMEHAGGRTVIAG